MIKEIIDRMEDKWLVKIGNNMTFHDRLHRDISNKIEQAKEKLARRTMLGSRKIA